MRGPSASRWPAFNVVARALLVLAIAAALVAGIAGGLLRAGVGLPVQAAGSWLGQAVLAHAFLMIGAFLGTVIGIERAVAVKQPWAFVAPLSSGLSGLLMLAGAAGAAAWLSVLAALAFVAVNTLVVVRQRAAHTALLLVAALAWLAGNGLHALGARAEAVVPWWFGFLVLTIVAERLEMTRLMRRRRGAAPALFGLVGALLLGGVASALALPWAGALYGASLLGLAAWLLSFDIARRTIRAQGLSRYMAVCLLLGYLWLAVSGVAWVAASLGQPTRDAAVHALALGFVFSMMLGHAPVILPAITGVKLQFGWVFYAPLALLHASLVVRLLLAPLQPGLLALGAAANAVAIVLFAATVVGCALAWRWSHPATARPQHDLPAEP